MKKNDTLDLSKSTIGERISILRKSKKLDRKTIIDALNISHATLSRIENNSTKSLSSEKIIKLSELFDVSCDFLIIGKEYTNFEFTSNRENAYSNPEIYELINLYNNLNQVDKGKVISYINFLKQH